MAFADYDLSDTEVYAAGFELLPDSTGLSIFLRSNSNASVYGIDEILVARLNSASVRKRQIIGERSRHVAVLESRMSDDRREAQARKVGRSW